jgi:hypothetical protein
MGLKPYRIIVNSCIIHTLTKSGFGLNAMVAFLQWEGRARF